MANINRTAQPSHITIRHLRQARQYIERLTIRERACLAAYFESGLFTDTLNELAAQGKLTDEVLGSTAALVETLKDHWSIPVRVTN